MSHGKCEKDSGVDSYYHDSDQETLILEGEPSKENRGFIDTINSCKARMESGELTQCTCFVDGASLCRSRGHTFGISHIQRGRESERHLSCLFGVMII